MFHENNPQATTSSQNAVQVGEWNRTPMIHTGDTDTHRVVVDRPPMLPSGTQKAIERIVQAHLERIGINAGRQEAEEKSRTPIGSTARNLPNPGPKTSQFSFPRMQENVVPPQGQQVFATAQRWPKEPPMFTGVATDDVYLWTSLVE